METLICIGALLFLMFVAYRGFSVIIFAPVAAMLAVLLTHPIDVAPVYSGLFMEKMVGFVKLYFPAFLLGAIFGKVIELSGFARSIVAAVIKARWPRARHSFDRDRLRDSDLWRRLTVCRGVRGLSVRGRDVPHERHSKAPHPRHDRTRRLYLHDGLAARHAADPEYHSNQLLRDGCLGRAHTRHRGRSLHPDNGDYLSGMAAQGCDAGARVMAKAIS